MFDLFKGVVKNVPDKKSSVGRIGAKKIKDGVTYVYLETDEGKPRWHSEQEVEQLRAELKAKKPHLFEAAQEPAKKDELNEAINSRVAEAKAGEGSAAVAQSEQEGAAAAPPAAPKEEPAVAAPAGGGAEPKEPEAANPKEPPKKAEDGKGKEGEWSVSFSPDDSLPGKPLRVYVRHSNDDHAKLIGVEYSQEAAQKKADSYIKRQKGVVG